MKNIVFFSILFISLNTSAQEPFTIKARVEDKDSTKTMLYITFTNTSDYDMFIRKDYTLRYSGTFAKVYYCDAKGDTIYTESYLPMANYTEDGGNAPEDNKWMDKVLPHSAHTYQFESSRSGFNVEGRGIVPARCIRIEMWVHCNSPDLRKGYHFTKILNPIWIN